MRAASLFLLLGFSALLCFCGKEKKATASAAPAPEQETATDSILKYWLGLQTVDSEKPFPNTLWFWTNWQELDSIESQSTLLRHAVARSEAEKTYDAHLFAKTWDANPVAGWLRSGTFQRKRDAWPCYWSIIPAAPIDSFAPPNQLIQVVLEDSALVVVFRPENKSDVFQVFDLEGNILPLPEAEKNKSRIALVFLETSGIVPGSAVRREPFRSFYLCNEKLIRSWHHGVPGVQDKVAMDINFLMLLHAWQEAHPAKAMLAGQSGFPSYWKGDKRKMSIAELVGSTQREGKKTEQNTLWCTTDAIDHIRYSWRLQMKPMERFPSKGLR